MFRKFTTLAVLISSLIAAPYASAQQTFTTATRTVRAVGRHQASAYNTWKASIYAGNGSTGASTITLFDNGVTLANQARIQPFSVTAPITIGSGATSETVTPTGVSGCSVNGPPQACQITASFTYLHGTGEIVTSGTYGLQEALNVAQGEGGGLVAVDGTFQGSTATITAATVYPNVVIEDTRGEPAYGTTVGIQNGIAGSNTQYWVAEPSGTTALAKGTTLVAAATCSASTTVCSGTAATLGGVSATWTSTANYFCYTYVDIMGHEGPCTSTANFTTTASVVVQVTAPAASPGAVGYLVYAGTSYATVTRLPIVGGATGGPTCILSTVQTVNPSCAVTNTTYGQVGSNATFALKEASTQPQPPGATITTFTTLQAFDNSYAAYAYTPVNVLPPYFTTNFVSFAASTGTSSTAWELGRALIPPGFLNQIGKSIRVTGEITETGNTVPSTGLAIAMGPPWTASAGATVCSMVNTTAQTAVVWNITFSCTITVQTASVAAGTGGTVLGNGWMAQSFTTQTTAGNLAVNNVVAAVTVNLYSGTEIDVILTPTSSTGMTAPQLLVFNVEALN